MWRKYIHKIINSKFSQVNNSHRSIFIKFIRRNKNIFIQQNFCCQFLVVIFQEKVMRFGYAAFQCRTRCPIAWIFYLIFLVELFAMNLNFTLEGLQIKKIRKSSRYSKFNVRLQLLQLIKLWELSWISKLFEIFPIFILEFFESWFSIFLCSCWRNFSTFELWIL